jgi:membrane protein implicated in regulation of membrane protease activity
VLTFLVIGGVGILLLVVALVLGDILDGVLDVGGDWFSSAALAGFLGAFGFSGALAVNAGTSAPLAIAIGLAAGVLVGVGAASVSLVLRRGGDEATVRTSDLAGRDAMVLSPIPTEGYGEVSVVAAGHITKLNARCSTALGAGEAVTIVGILSPTSVVVEPRSVTRD